MPMSLRTKITVGVCVLVFCAAGAVIFFQKEIRIAYHRNRMFAAMENYMLLSGQGPKVTRFDMLKFLAFRTSDHKEGEAMFQHEKALIKLVHLDKREFTFTNKVFKGFGHSWPSFRQQITNTFGDRHCWPSTILILETNRLAITATPEDMPKWQKLISDFDQ